MRTGTGARPQCTGSSASILPVVCSVSRCWAAAESGPVSATAKNIEGCSKLTWLADRHHPLLINAHPSGIYGTSLNTNATTRSR